jgi:hypothetical protein
LALALAHDQALPGQIEVAVAQVNAFAAAQAAVQQQEAASAFELAKRVGTREPLVQRGLQALTLGFGQMPRQAGGPGHGAQAKDTGVHRLVTFGQPA